MKLLIIEHSSEIIKGISLIFKLHWPDAVVLSASKGKDGIRDIKAKSPDIIILDVNLPEINGFEILKSIRSISNVPVIVLNVSDDEADQRRGLELGADDYIFKPFSPADLLTRVQVVLRRCTDRQLKDST
jgi:DNA-binding response OmpR family regulator